MVASTPGQGPDAGGSALETAARLELDIACISRQISSLTVALQELQRLEGRFRAGAAGERHAVRALLDQVHDGWSLLADRRWPGTRSANLDVLLVGPGGVIVADVKRWREVHIAAGRLHRGQEPADDQVEAVAAQARAVQEVLVHAGLAPGEVVPVLVLDGADLPPTPLAGALGRVQALGERHLARYLLGRAARLDAEQVATVLAALDARCPPAARRERRAPEPQPAPGPQPAPEPRPAAGPRPAAEPHPALLSTDDVYRTLLEAAAAEPIESWMTWLHPTQARLVTSRWNGPARVRGAAGTGKTVVALHRARHLAAHGRRVLFTSYVTTLSPVFQSLFARLAPDLAGQVEFLSVHKTATRLLRAAGRPAHVDQPGVDTCFWRAWGNALRQGSPLATLGVPPGYWREEIAHVIKGRGVTDAAAYADLPRLGRGTALGAAHRAAVWQLYQDYERLREEKGLVDWDDVLLAARRAVTDGDAASAWDAVIVDEVQDLTGAGLRLLHALVGDRPDGLLLVGDGRQSLYPGGASLAETGISVVGRSAVLHVNYRNAAAVLNAALALAGDDTFDDGTDAVPPVQVQRDGGSVVRAPAADAASQRRDLLAHLESLHAGGVRYGDVALLVPTNAAAGTWLRHLRDAGVPAMLLADYTGTRCEAVKVGTFERAKALEFAHVLIPDSDRLPGPRRPAEPDDVYAERAARERNRLHVGCTRPRDGLWLGTTTTGPPPDLPGAVAS